MINMQDWVLTPVSDSEKCIAYFENRLHEKSNDLVKLLRPVL